MINLQTPRRVFALTALALLASCGTPQERCINSATRELRTVTGLREEVQANLARGYAIETYEVTRTVWEICGVQAPPAEPQYCLEDDTETRTRRVAIDPAAEQRKLDGLLRKEAALTQRAKTDIAACRQEFPE